jgi:hypothetical protein
MASDLAMSYYGIKPLRTNDALAAWTNALKLARDEIEREGVYIHFARIETQAGMYEDAHKRLDAVTNEMYADLKARVSRTLKEKEHPELTTNEPALGPELPASESKTNAPEVPKASSP